MIQWVTKYEAFSVIIKQLSISQTVSPSTPMLLLDIPPRLETLCKTWLLLLEVFEQMQFRHTQYQLSFHFSCLVYAFLYHHTQWSHIWTLAMTCACMRLTHCDDVQALWCCCCFLNDRGIWWLSMESYLFFFLTFYLLKYTSRHTS